MVCENNRCGVCCKGRGVEDKMVGVGDLTIKSVSYRLSVRILAWKPIVAQLVERLTVDQLVAGSIPADRKNPFFAL